MATEIKSRGPESSVATPWTLIRRLKGRPDAEEPPVDEVAWHEFYAMYHGLIYGLALKSGLPPEEAEEAVQDTLTSVFKNMPAFKADPAAGSFKSWLCRLAHWRIQNQIDRVRRAERWHSGNPPKDAGDDTASTPTVDRIPAPSPKAEAVWDAEWRAHIIDMAFAKMKQRVRAKDYQVFYLTVKKECPTAEVARTVRVKRAQVYLINFRVKREFERIIRELESQPI